MKGIGKRHRSLYRIDELFYSQPVFGDGESDHKEQKHDKAELQQRVERRKPHLRAKLTRFKYRSCGILRLSLVYIRLNSDQAGELVCTCDHIQTDVSAIIKKERVYLPGEVTPAGDMKISFGTHA